jgi:hypothetical protein
MACVSGNGPLVTFDMDGVLCRPPLGINPGKGRNKRRDRTGKRNLLWYTEAFRYAGRRPMPGAVDGLRAAEQLAECHVVSARAEQARQLTERWFMRYFGEVPVLHLRPSWEETSAQFKVRRLSELGAVAHFEDDPHTARWLAESLSRVYLLDWWRNRWLDGENITRIQRISDALPSLAVLLERAPDR